MAQSGRHERSQGRHRVELKRPKRWSAPWFDPLVGRWQMKFGG